MFCGAVGWTEASPTMGSDGQRDCGVAQAMIREAKARCRMFGRMLWDWGMLLDCPRTL